MKTKDISLIIVVIVVATSWLLTRRLEGPAATVFSLSASNSEEPAMSEAELAKSHMGKAPEGVVMDRADEGVLRVPDLSTAATRSSVAHVPTPAVPDSREISITDISGLVTYLVSGDPGRTPDGRNFKNTIMDALVHYSRDLPDVADRLIAIYEDRTQDPVIRDYALQHLGIMAPGAPSDKQELIKAALLAALEQPSGTYSGTALLALYRWDRVQRKQVADEAVVVAMNDRAANISRATALQVCAELGDARIAPLAVTLAQKHPSVAVRKSAVAALRKLAAGESTLTANVDIAGLLEICHDCF